MLKIRRSVGWTVLFCGLFGCAATETGNPPFSYHVEPDTVAVEAIGSQSLPAEPLIRIAGGPGAVEPATGQIYAWGLKNDLPPAVSGVQADGSFSVEVRALEGERIRLQVRGEGDASSPPIDLVAFEAGFAKVTTELRCFESFPSLAIALDAAVGNETVIELRNRCDVSVTRSRARLREGLAGIELRDQGSLEMAPHDVAQLTLTVTSDVVLVDNVVFSLASPVSEVRAITVGTSH